MCGDTARREPTGRRIAPVFLRAKAVVAVLRSASSNPALRRIGFSYALFGMAELGIWIALLIYAYGHGGTSAGTTMVLVQLVPCIVLGPFLGAFADRHSAHHVLCWGYAFQAVAMGGVAAAIGLGAPIIVVFALAPLTALGLSATRPAQAAVLPAVVQTADELTAANVMSGWTFGAASLVGPAVAGVLIAWHGAGAAVAAAAAMSMASLLLVVGLRTVPVADGAEAGPAGDGREQGWLHSGLVDLRGETRANLRCHCAQQAVARPALAARLLLRADRRR